MKTTEIERLRANIAFIISENPVRIQITKKMYIDNGTGGKTEVVTVPKGFIGRIFATAIKPATDIIQPAGVQHRNEYKLLAPFNAEIDEVTEDVKQTFIVDNITYLITELAIVKRSGQIISKEMILLKAT